MRPATHAQNSINGTYVKTKDSLSTYIGVFWLKRRKKWRAQIRFNGIQKTIGYFNDEIKAAKAYDEAAKKYHGDFAVLNFPAQ